VSLFKRVDTEVEILSERFEDPNRYQETENTIARTWQISFDQILKQDQLAASYLSFMACIDRINIPQSLLPVEGTVVQRLKAPWDAHRIRLYRRAPAELSTSRRREIL
jgi:hypothetical protein